MEYAFPPAVIASLPTDIVGLQELDLGRKRSAGVDQAGLIAAGKSLSV